MKKTYVIVIIIGVIVLLLASFFYFAVPGIPCELKGGRIVNALGFQIEGKEPCEPNEINQGPVKGFRCPCVCCVPSK